MMAATTAAAYRPAPHAIPMEATTQTLRRAGQPTDAAAIVKD